MGTKSSTPPPVVQKLPIRSIHEVKPTDGPILMQTIITGASKSGKSHLVYRYTCDAWGVPQGPILPYQSKISFVGPWRVRHVIWDTSAGSNFRDPLFQKPYYRAADAVILCMDLTDVEAVDNARLWFEQFRSWKLSIRTDIQNIPIALVGTKLDLTRERVITRQQAEELCVSMNQQLPRVKPVSAMHGTCGVSSNSNSNSNSGSHEYFEDAYISRVDWKQVFAQRQQPQTVMYFEASASSGEGVREVFEFVERSYMESLYRPDFAGSIIQKQR